MNKFLTEALNEAKLCQTENNYIYCLAYYYMINYRNKTRLEKILNSISTPYATEGVLDIKKDIRSELSEINDCLFVLKKVIDSEEIYNQSIEILASNYLKKLEAGDKL